MKSVGKICLTEKKLETFLTEAEAVINSRPLVYVGEDFDSGFSLTPADFLNLNAKSGIIVISIAFLLFNLLLFFNLVL